MVIICADGACAIKADQSDETTMFAQSSALQTEIAQKFAELFPVPEDKNNLTEEEDESEDFEQNAYEYPLWQWLSILSFAIGFSLLGITSSVVARGAARNKTDNNRRSAGVIITYFMAAASGVLMVSLFAGGILQGTLFPDFTGDELNFGFNSWVALKFRGSDWFKLAIWCYVAGFYERFIPNVLDRVLEKSETKPANDANVAVYLDKADGE